MGIQFSTPHGVSSETLTPPKVPVVRDGDFSISQQIILDSLQRGDDPTHENIPPLDFWLVDPHDKTNKIDTPVDDRGLVDPYRLVTEVKKFVHPDYVWTGNLSIHHLYWKGYWYGFPSAGEHAREFRELPIHKILVPRIFENCVHKMTNPPDVPGQEVMAYRAEAWTVAKSLFKSVRSVVEWEKRAATREEQLAIHAGILPEAFNGEDKIGKEILRGTLKRHFRGMEAHMLRLQTVPQEFRLVEVETDLTEKEVRRQFAKDLGRVVVPRAIPMTRVLRAA